MVSEENPEPIIVEDSFAGDYCVVFDPLDGETKGLIIQEVEQVVNYDPRVALDQIEVLESEHGIQVRMTVLYIGYGLGESINLLFDNQQGLLQGPTQIFSNQSY